MDNLQLKQVPSTKTGMLIRKPVAEWPGDNGPTTVQWMFAPQKDGTTIEVH